MAMAGGTSTINIIKENTEPPLKRVLREKARKAPII
jgi:hypothetical protein